MDTMSAEHNGHGDLRQPNVPDPSQPQVPVSVGTYTSPVNAIDAVNQQSQSARAFDQLLEQYRALAASETERMKGNLFEQLIANYLRSDAQMSQQFSGVYLWRDWPGRDHRPDTGIDLVAHRAEDGAAVAIQCKFYATTHRIQKTDLDSFLSESGKKPYRARIIVETTGQSWSANAEQAIEDQQIPVTRIGLTDLRNSNIDWSTYELEDPKAQPQIQERKTLRDHQVAAISDVMKGFKDHDRGTLIMACGTGKTFTSLKLAEKMAEERGGNMRVLFMVPSLALMTQTLGEWSAECSLPFHAWSVCSDIKVNRRRAAQEDIVDISVTELKIPPTTHPQPLADSLAKSNDADGLQVVFSTYQSIDVISTAQTLGGESWRDFDLIICDEAHRTTGVTLTPGDESAFVKIHDNNLIRADKRLYMTATPRLFKPEVKKAASEKDAILASMDNEDIYGPVFHRLGFGQAVAMGLLTDYKVAVLGVPETEMSALYQAAAAEEGELNLPEMAKLAGCWNAFAKRKNAMVDVSYGEDKAPMRRAVIFAKDIKTSEWVSDEFPRFVSEHLQSLTNQDPTDDLSVECRHVDGKMNAMERGEALDWLKADPEDTSHPICRVLTNARCLSEGVDVPSLDAVMFLNPRKSQVDVIQAVGRVMRKAPGKQFGYIILPVAIPIGVTPEEALNNNDRYRVIWQVLQAIRAHDERFDSKINSIQYNTDDPRSIIVDVVNLKPPQPQDHFQGSAQDSDDTDLDGKSGQSLTETQGVFNLNPFDWKDAVYSMIVKKVGDRLYWSEWSKDIADIAGRFIDLIEHRLDEPHHQELFEHFVDALRRTLNPSIDNAQAVEMLAQHIITKPLFDAMFTDQRFTQENPVSQAMQSVLDKLATNREFELERKPLEKFYKTMVRRIEDIDNVVGKQQIMVTLYDKFFSKAFPAMADRLGIVFTPVEVVDYILHSANDALKEHFGKTLGEPGTDLLEPFVGTGTFITRLLASGIIAPEQLEFKYKNEIFANEVVLLSYYIASINIEAVYREIRKDQGYPDEYAEFTGISLTDTFQMNEADNTLEHESAFAANNQRVKRQKKASIKVVVMNPPYSAGQSSANDNNQNLKYPRLDQRIKETYVLLSTGTLKNSLYDSYYRAFRWATDRVGDEGIIAFVSNNAFLEGNTADGVRLTFQKEFSDIYIYNLKGNQRTQGERSRREGGKIFGSGSRTGIAITVMVKDKKHQGSAVIHYAEVDDYLTRQEKLNLLKRDHSITGTSFETVTPNKFGDWISPRDENFDTFQEIGNKQTKGKVSTPAVFVQFSGGLKTGRDAWCFNFSKNEVKKNMQRMIETYNQQVKSGFRSSNAETDPTEISWNRQLLKDLDRKKLHQFNEVAIRPAMYRPFTRQNAYFKRDMTDLVSHLPQVFPIVGNINLAIALSVSGTKEFSPFLVENIPDFHLNGDSQCFSLYTWARLETPREVTLLDSLGSGPDHFAGSFDFNRPIGEQVPRFIGDYERRDNITDATLKAYQTYYQKLSITKEDIFFYVYALLHHREYRERYEADLKKMLPRIPKCADFDGYAEVGRELADLHVNYERVEPYQLHESWRIDAPVDDWKKYHVEKLAWDKHGKQADASSMIYNEYLTLAGIPKGINIYRVGGRSPLEWMIDRYRITQDKKSGIVNDPNDYFREVNNPSYLVDLIKSLVTVSMRTQDLVNGLPPFAPETLDDKKSFQP